MVKKVVVDAGYRLHLGFYRFYDPPFKYGAIGLGISEPRFKLIIKVPGKGRVDGIEGEGRNVIYEVLKKLSIQKRLDIEFNGFINYHVGLGSITRLVMALLLGLNKLNYLNDDVISLARKMGRGKISSVGIFSSLYGGFIIDSGLYNDKPPQLLLRFNFPNSWYAIVVIPKNIKGLSDETEHNILKEPEPFKKQKSLYKHLTMLITSLKLKDFKLFSKSLGKIQRLTGEYFSRYQGGIYCCEEVSEIINHMRGSMKITGVGQSSWGPTCYGFTMGFENAKRVWTSIKKYLLEIGINASVIIAPPDNYGMLVKVLNFKEEES